MKHFFKSLCIRGQAPAQNTTLNGQITVTFLWHNLSKSYKGGLRPFGARWATTRREMMLKNSSKSGRPGQAP